jgi:hypothetical protein
MLEKDVKIGGMSRPHAALALVLWASVASGQVTGSVVAPGGISFESGRFRLRGEIKINARDSTQDSQTVGGTQTPFPIVMATVSPYGSAEISNVALIGEADFTPDISAKVEIHFIDLYNRNPTSSDDRVFLREAWVRFGKKYEPLQPQPGTTLYLQLGKAPRFTKQVVRRLESYGLWGTAVGRFEEMGAEAGGSLGPLLYWRASVASGNPLFFRDPNALAGDNGTPERTVGSTTPVVYQSGFPILYDAKTNDVNLNGKFQFGGGMGVRLVDPATKNGVDIVGWYFHRTLADRAPIRGSFYGGDLRLLQGFAVPLPYSGNEKWEAGANLEARYGPVHLYGQYVYQNIAELVRKGFEFEASWRIPLNGLFASGDESVVNWIAPTVRYSKIDNEFEIPIGYVAPSVGWYWDKYDAGVRIGIIRGIDLTAEYALNNATAPTRVLHPNEFLLTLRAGF